MGLGDGTLLYENISLRYNRIHDKIIAVPVSEKGLLDSLSFGARLLESTTANSMESCWVDKKGGLMASRRAVSKAENLVVKMVGAKASTLVDDSVATKDD